MATVERTPPRISPLRPRRPLDRDRGLDLRLVPGTIVDHPDDVAGIWGPAARAMLIQRDDSDGIHDWLIIRCEDEPGAEMTVASFPTLTGARIRRLDPEEQIDAAQARVEERRGKALAAMAGEGRALRAVTG